jgi:hypothetical protein
VSYTNEDDELVEREIKLGTNYVEDRWIKVALMVGTRNESRLMELYVDGNRTGATSTTTPSASARTIRNISPLTAPGRTWR